MKGFAVDRRDATSAYPDWRAQQQSVEQMYVDAGAVPPSLRIWADGVDVRDSPELWPDRYLRPHRGMRPVVWARMRRDVDGLTIWYTVDGKTADTPEEAAGLRVPEGWSLVYATLEQPLDWEPGARQVYAPGRRGGRGRRGRRRPPLPWTGKRRPLAHARTHSPADGTLLLEWLLTREGAD